MIHSQGSTKVSVMSAAKSMFQISQHHDIVSEMKVYILLSHCADSVENQLSLIKRSRKLAKCFSREIYSYELLF